MKNHRSRFKLWLLFAGCAALSTLSAAPSASAQKFEINPVAEKKVTELPAGPWYWLIENFHALQQAQTAAGSTSLVAEVSGKVWLFTLGAKGAAGHGGSRVAEIGPVAPISAPEYLLRVNDAGGPPGVKTPVHTHPGSETFYVLSGQLDQRTPHGENRLDAGQAMPGHGPGMPMQISSSGSSDLKALVMFVVDATKPFSSPATMP
jgi:hypothetical protein